MMFPGTFKGEAIIRVLNARMELVGFIADATLRDGVLSEDSGGIDLMQRYMERGCKLILGPRFRNDAPEKRTYEVAVKSPAQSEIKSQHQN